LPNLTAEYILINELDNDVAHEYSTEFLECADALLEQYKQEGEPKVVTQTDANVFSIESKLPRIKLHLSTPGGSLESALCLYNVIRMVERRGVVFDIQVLDCCYSSGLILLQAASNRIATPQSSFCFHSMKYSSSESFHAHDFDWCYTHYTQKIAEIMAARNTKNVPVEQWKHLFSEKGDTFMNAQECLSLGVIDLIYPPL
jgi:ATP-dependent protease ClpP protease subunit